jgi:hypothetical protein
MKRSAFMKRFMASRISWLSWSSSRVSAGTSAGVTAGAPEDSSAPAVGTRASAPMPQPSSSPPSTWWNSVCTRRAAGPWRSAIAAGAMRGSGVVVVRVMTWHGRAMMRCVRRRARSSGGVGAAPCVRAGQRACARGVLSRQLLPRALVNNERRRRRLRLRRRAHHAPRARTHASTARKKQKSSENKHNVYQRPSAPQQIIFTQS